MARPRKQDALDIQARAVQEAIALLRQDQTITLSAVARRVGCSAPALYAHFVDKNDLLRAVRAAAFAEMTRVKATRYAAPTADPATRLRDGGHAYVAFARENPRLYRLLYAPAPEIGAESDRIAKGALDALSAGVRAAQQVGLAPGTPAGDVAEVLWFTVHGAVMMALDGQLPGPAEARWNRAHRAVDRIVALMSAPPDPKDR